MISSGNLTNDDSLSGKWSKAISEQWKKVYSNPENLVEIKFYNTTDCIKYVWVEPAAYSIELEPNTEYKIVTHEKQFSIEYDSESQITLRMDYSFGFKLYKKEVKNANDTWVLDVDISDIN
jgi:hypothetical protein